MTNTTPLRNPKKRIFDEATWLLMFVLDSTVILTSVAMAYALRYLFVWPDLFGGIIRAVPAEFYVQWSAFIPIALLLLVLMQAQFTIRGMYRLPPNSPLTAHLRIIFNSTTTAAAILVVVVFSYRPLYYSRLVIALVFALVIILLSLLRVALVLVRRVRWSRGIGRERYIIVGGGDVSHALMTGIVARPHLGYALVGTSPIGPTTTSQPLPTARNHSIFTISVGSKSCATCSPPTPSTKSSSHCRSTSSICCRGWSKRVARPESTSDWYPICSN